MAEPTELSYKARSHMLSHQQKALKMAGGRIYLAILILALCILSGECREEESSRKPNIVIFIMDDVGMGDIGCFGNTTMNTPNIDQLAREGAKLSQHIAHPICTPSRAALMTGRYAIRSGMCSYHIMRVISFISAPAGLPSNETTIAELAKTVGYSTGLIGKWHLGFTCSPDDGCSDPNSQGFDYFYGLPLTNILDCGSGTVFEAWRKNFYTEVAVALAVLNLTTFVLVMCKFAPQRMLYIVTVLSVLFYIFCLLIPRIIATMNCVIMENKRVVEQPLSYTNLTQRHTQKALKFLESNRDNPFLLVMSFLQAHTELYAEPHFRNSSRHGMYGAAVEELDWSVGQIMGKLHRLGLAQDTFVYITSDNGAHVEEFTKHGHREGGSNGIYKGGKANCFEGGIRVPTIASYPGVIPAGSEVSEPTSVIDVLPTVAGLIGAQVPTDRAIDGKDMMPLMTQHVDRSPHEFLFQYCGAYLHGARYTPPDGKAVYKLHYATVNFVPGPDGTLGCFDAYPCRCEGPTTIHHDPPLIYELTSDPSESSPLDPSTPEMRAIIAKAEEAVRDHQASIGPTSYQFSFMKLMPRVSDQPCCGRFCQCTEDHSTEFSYDAIQPDIPRKDWTQSGHIGAS
ncbi:steryl-sulfatase-like [Diadema antillarum]|uniref:steryl-sulfatase-like n=1 Tax=Diadema antillarum TaxID=105358 RepID=UPI003A8C04B9